MAGKHRTPFTGLIIQPEGTVSEPIKVADVRVKIPTTANLAALEKYLIGAIKQLRDAGVKTVSGRLEGWK